MSTIAPVVGLIGLVVLVSLIVAAYSPIMGSVAADATANDIGNSTHNATYQTGTEVAQGFMGLNQAQVAVLIILLIIVVFLLIFAL